MVSAFKAPMMPSSVMIVIIKEGESKERRAEPIVTGIAAVIVVIIVVVIIVVAVVVVTVPACLTMTVLAEPLAPFPTAVPAVDFLDETFVQLRGRSIS